MRAAVKPVVRATCGKLRINHLLVRQRKYTDYHRLEEYYKISMVARPSKLDMAQSKRCFSYPHELGRGFLKATEGGAGAAFSECVHEIRWNFCEKSVADQILKPMRFHTSKQPQNSFVVRPTYT